MPKQDKERNKGGARPATKRTREGSSQTDDEDYSILDRLIVIEEKLTTLLQLVPELEGLIHGGIV